MGFSFYVGQEPEFKYLQPPNLPAPEARRTSFVPRDPLPDPAWSGNIKLVKELLKTEPPIEPRKRRRVSTLLRAETRAKRHTIDGLPRSNRFFPFSLQRPLHSRSASLAQLTKNVLQQETRTGTLYRQIVQNASMLQILPNPSVYRVNCVNEQRKEPQNPKGDNTRLSAVASKRPEVIRWDNLPPLQLYSLNTDAFEFAHDIPHLVSTDWRQPSMHNLNMSDNSSQSPSSFSRPPPKPIIQDFAAQGRPRLWGKSLEPARHIADVLRSPFSAHKKPAPPIPAPAASKVPLSKKKIARTETNTHVFPKALKPRIPILVSSKKPAGEPVDQETAGPTTPNSLSKKSLHSPAASTGKGPQSYSRPGVTMNTSSTDVSRFRKGSWPSPAPTVALPPLPTSSPLRRATRINGDISRSGSAVVTSAKSAMSPPKGQTNALPAGLLRQMKLPAGLERFPDLRPEPVQQPESTSTVSVAEDVFGNGSLAANMSSEDLLNWKTQRTQKVQALKKRHRDEIRSAKETKSAAIGKTRIRLGDPEDREDATATLPHTGDINNTTSMELPSSNLSKSAKAQATTQEAIASIPRRDSERVQYKDQSTPGSLLPGLQDSFVRTDTKGPHDSYSNATTFQTQHRFHLAEYHDLKARVSASEDRLVLLEQALTAALNATSISAPRAPASETRGGYQAGNSNKGLLASGNGIGAEQRLSEYSAASEHSEYEGKVEKQLEAMIEKLGQAGNENST